MFLIVSLFLFLNNTSVSIIGFSVSNFALLAVFPFVSIIGISVSNSSCLLLFLL